MLLDITLYLVYIVNNQQLLDKVEQNIMICQWQANQLLAEVGENIEK